MKNKIEIDVLDILDQLDEFRRNHQNEMQNSSEWCMRMMEAIVARAGGYTTRNEWTDQLKSISSRFSRDYNNPNYWDKW